MHSVTEFWSLAVILFSAFIIGWGAEAAQTFIPRAVALSILAWMQTLPEFAVEAAIAWDQERDLMIANLTGSLRLIVGLGWPMVFFVHALSRGTGPGQRVRQVVLDDEDFLTVNFLFLAIAYFLVILAKGSLSVADSVVLIALYCLYLYLGSRLPTHEIEDVHDLPLVARKVVALGPAPRVLAVSGLFTLGGAGLYLSVHPFLDTIQRWGVSLGISTFVFIQWVAPFLSEFPEYLSAFNWARQRGKAPMALMNLASSNINQWTMLAAMIPIVFNLSLGRWEPIYFDRRHSLELGLTIAQSAIGGLLLLDMRLSVLESGLMLVLWVLQFFFSDLRLYVAYAYLVWIAIHVGLLAYRYFSYRRVPRAFTLAAKFARGEWR